MNDTDGPQIAAWFYKALFWNRDHVDIEDVPYALDAASSRLRQQDVSIDRYSIFIHMGA